MKLFKRISALALILIMAFGAVAVPASAKTAAPLSISVKTSKTECEYTDVVKVVVTVKNTSAKKVSNIVVTSEDSKGLVMVKPEGKNVVIKTPGKPDTILAKSNAMTTCLQPGATLKYTYYVALGYAYSRHKIPEATSDFMLRQHKILNTTYFFDTGLSGSAVKSTTAIKFGDVNTKLLVKAYYSVKTATYDALESELSTNVSSSGATVTNS